MREIKFRAWVKDKDKMVDVSSIEFDGCGFPKAKSNQVIWEVGYRRRNVGYVWEHESNIEIMQSTGIKDKNGTEIYEGDILTDHGDEGPLYVKYSNEHAAFVFVDKFDPFGVTSYTTLQISYEQFEVIGNIYENPELVGVE